MRSAPLATYRVQLRREFDFADATAIVPYLAGLGVSHLYCSPYLQAARGSAHGYDVVDPTRISDELGGDAGLAALDAALALHRMGQLLDIVPNHMCISDPGNRWWWDVLEHGRASRFAPYFDIDWDAPGLDGRLLLPVLGDTLESVVARGELQVAGGADGFVLRYFDSVWPLAEGSAAAAGPADASLLGRQWYTLEHWRTGLPRVNYRRFFDVASLAALHAEIPSVHDATHRRVLQLVEAGTVEGLRVDHVDGLHDPTAYTERLRDEAPRAWRVLEKILAADEQLPAWPVDGTTGYEFAARVAALMTDASARDAMTRIHQELTGDRRGFREHARSARLEVLDALLASDLDRLTRAAAAAGIADARTELAELLAGMPVYRLYPRQWAPLTDAEHRHLDAAALSATESGRCRPQTLIAIIRVLTGRGDPSPAAIELRVRFQQVSAAATAKGIEDTAFYRYVRLVALNEVGADPDRFGLDAGAFHEACVRESTSTRRGLLATATHDTKRGEDARIRVAMLSEMPDAWRDAVLRWRRFAGRHRGALAPSPVAEYLFYQTMVAAHPIDAGRMTAYMQKAVREAKQETSWLDPDAAYEAELDAFVRGMLADAEFVADVDGLVAAMTPAWQVASLSQTLLKLTCPGVPDIYQGCELWDLSLVDPDNRRPVDHGLRRRLLAELDGMTPEQVMARSVEGLPKLHLIRCALGVRDRHAAAFAPYATHHPIAARGSHAAHAVAFSRQAPDAPPEVVVVALRLARSLGGDWGDTELDLPPGAWRSCLTGDSVDSGDAALSRLLARFPVALLERA